MEWWTLLGVHPWTAGDQRQTCDYASARLKTTITHVIMKSRWMLPEAPKIIAVGKLVCLSSKSLVSSATLLLQHSSSLFFAALRSALNNHAVTGKLLLGAIVFPSCHSSPLLWTTGRGRGLSIWRSIDLYSWPKERKNQSCLSLRSIKNYGATLVITFELLNLPCILCILYYPWQL